jgi:hypothetical protein
MDVKMQLINSPFDGFDWSALDSPEFQEDAVREEIIAPLLWALGYKAAPPNKIVRSKRLEHPFVALGTTQHRISLIHDYLMYADERPAWILDAKSPRESVVDSDHEAQAYSYVCHRDVRADWYAVCNGREFAAFHVADMSREPRLRFPIAQLADYWSDLWHSLAPETVRSQDGSYLKDFGIHLLKMGFTHDMELTFLSVAVPSFGRADDSAYSINAPVLIEDQKYFATFDFDKERLNQLIPLLRPDLAAHVSQALAKVPSLLTFGGDYFPRVGATARLATKMQENAKEHYLPLEVLEFRPAL